MNGGTKLFKIFNISIRLHFSWWFIFFLLAWSLSVSFFPEQLPGKSNLTYWLMGIFAALMLFISVLLHELSHSLVAKAKKIKVESITLFFFGGIAGIDDEEIKPSTEFLMAVAGPMFSLLLSGIFYSLFFLIHNEISKSITYYLYVINLVIAVFNLIPGFPLDGGRAFRAILHGYYRDIRKATKIAAFAGKLFAGYMVLEGILNIFGFMIVIPGGLWFIFLGGFLYFIAGMSYEQILVKSVLQKIGIKSLRLVQPIIIKNNLRMSEFIQKYSSLGENIFLIGDSSKKKVLDIERIEKINRDLSKLTVGQAALPLSPSQMVNLNESAYAAFKKMSQNNNEAVFVMDKDKVVGLLTKKVIAHRLYWDFKFNNNELGRKRAVKLRKRIKLKK